MASSDLQQNKPYAAGTAGAPRHLCRPAVGGSSSSQKWGGLGSGASMTPLSSPTGFVRQPSSSSSSSSRRGRGAPVRGGPPAKQAQIPGKPMTGMDRRRMLLTPGGKELLAHLDNQAACARESDPADTLPPVSSAPAPPNPAATCYFDLPKPSSSSSSSSSSSDCPL